MNREKTPAELEEFALRQRDAADREAAVALLESNSASDLRDCLARIHVPALVMHSKDDKAVPFHHAREISAALPSAELVPFEGDHADWCLGDLGVRYSLLLSRFFGGSGVETPVSAPLSERELEVLRLVATGCTSRQIASLLSLSDRTVESHIQNIFAKLDVHNRVEAANWAREHGII